MDISQQWSIYLFTQHLSNYLFINQRTVQINTMTDQFDFMNKIGEGAFASVYKVKRKEDNSLYAFKKIKADKIGNQELNNSLNQIRILASVKSPYVISYKEAFYDQTLKSFCLVTQFAEGGDLSAKINKLKKNKQVFQEKEIWKIAIQILFGVKALHSLNIFHRDIKPANILLTTSDAEAKLADMNVSIISKTGLAKTQTGTPYYASPEVWLERPYDGKSDIWSLGCVLYQMAALAPPFTARDIPALRRRIIQGEYSRIPSNYSNQLEVFIRCCLTKDAYKRPSVKDLLNLPVIKDKMKLFPNEKFNQNTLPCLQNKSAMIATIRIPNRNLSQAHFKLPKCNYEKQNDKENGGDILNQNNSCVGSKKSPKNQPLPTIKRSESANQKSNPSKPSMRREYLRKNYY